MSPRRLPMFAAVLVLVLAAVLAPRPARADVQAGGVTTPPHQGFCAYGAVAMGSYGGRILVKGLSALWGSVGTAVCNTWASGPPRQLSVSFTLWRQLPLVGKSICGGNPAYPGWQTAVTDVLDLRDPATGDRVIEHRGCGPGWYQVELKTSYKDAQGVWRHGKLFTAWEFYNLPLL